MTFPFGLGSGIGGPSIVGMRRLLKRLLPKGYAEAGALLEELECWAAMLYDAHTLPQRIANESFVSLTSELIDEWEREYRLPNDAARTLEQRQARLVAAEQAIGGSIRSRVESALREVSADAEWLVNERAHIQADVLDLQPELIFQHVVQLSEAEWAKPAVRRGVARVIQRMSAARAHFADGFVDPNEIVVANVDAEWGSVDHVIGRDALRQTETPDLTTYWQRARIRQYGPLTKLRAADLNAIQDAVFYQRVTDGTDLDALDGSQAGRVALAFALEAAVGPSSSVCDRAADWRNRLVTVWVSTAPDDIRPGQASDDNVGTSTVVQKLWYTGAGATDAGAAASGASCLLDTDVYLYADDTTGYLKVRNVAAGTRYVVAMLHATGPVNDVSGNELRYRTFVDGQTCALLNDPWYEAWSRAGMTRQPETSGPAMDADEWGSLAGAGGAFIFAVVPAVLRGQTVVVDALRDWTDRLLAVTCVSIQVGRWAGVGSTDPAWPGSSRFDQLQSAPAQTDHTVDVAHTGFCYTREGDASGAAIAGTMVALETSARVWVDDTALSLKLTRDAGDAHTPPETYLLLIHATEQLGERSTPDVLDLLGVNDGDPIQPQEMNQAQDRALVTQAAGVQSVPASATRNLPLGGKSDPLTPSIPEVWPSRDSNTADTLQPVAGWVRAYFSGVVPGGGATTLVIDTSRDWRDRFVWAQIAWSSTTDRHLEGATPTGINAAAGTTRHSTARYTGDGVATIWADAGDNPYGAAVDGTGYGLRLVSDDDASCILLYARASDGALCVFSPIADTALTVMVEGTFQLGTRKV